jgi:peptide/nickel transport system substrate-binding protein
MYSFLLPIYQVGWIPDFFDAHNFMYTWMHEMGYWAFYSGYDNDYVDELVETAIVSTDPAERQAIYDELAQIYYDECPGILLVQPTGNRHFADWVQGFYFNPGNAANYGWTYDLRKTYEDID